MRVAGVPIAMCLKLAVLIVLERSTKYIFLSFRNTHIVVENTDMRYKGNTMAAVELTT